MQKGGPSPLLHAVVLQEQWIRDIIISAAIRIASGGTVNHRTCMRERERRVDPLSSPVFGGMDICKQPSLAK